MKVNASVGVPVAVVGSVDTRMVVEVVVVVVVVVSAVLRI